MKKALFLASMILAAGTFSVNAQGKEKVETKEEKTKVKPRTTVGDKMHNVVHPHEKNTHGWKYKHKNKVTGKKTKVEQEKRG